MGFSPLAYLGTPQATTTFAGKTRYATITETQAGLSQALAVTPAGLAAVAIAGAPAASTAQAGIIQIATNGQSIDPLNTNLAIVPSNIPSIMASPGDIGGSTPGAGTFTTLTITDLVLTNPLSVPEGGTGVATMTDHGIVLGSGAGAVSVTAVGANNQLLIGQTNADPIWSDNIDVVGTLDVTGVATFDDNVVIAGDLTVDTPTFFVDASQSNVGIGTITPAAADKLHVTQSTAGTAMIVEFENTNANTASHSQVLVQTSGATGGDPKLTFDVAAVAQFTIGMDNSVSDQLCISTGTAPGTTDNITVATTGAVGILRGDVTVTRDAGAAASLGVNITNTNAADADSNALLAITSGNANSGDPQVNLIVTGGSTHHIGIDNSDSDALKIGLGATVGTTDNLKIATTGAFSVLRGDLDVTRSATGNVIGTVSNTSVGAGTDNAVVQVTSGGAAGGDAQINFTVTGATSHYLGIDNSTSDSLKLGFGTAVGTTAAQVWDVAGQITYPLQPSFLAYLAGTATNKTGNGTSYTIGTDALTEVFDRNADFNTNGTFTAPVTGLYNLHAQVTITGATIATTFVIRIVTTARTYTKTFIKAAGSQDESIDITALADMSATDTATVTITVTGEGADTDDIKGGAALETYFCGNLVA
jgi:hypothetical protein